MSPPAASPGHLLGSIFLFASVLLSLPGYASTQTDCPWDQAGLLMWSDIATWNGASGSGEVVIPSGKHVLLNVQPATLTTLTIQANASLVWGNVADLELRTHYILVDGAFIMGSTTCRLQHKAFIKLRGRYDSVYRAHLHNHANSSMPMEGSRKFLAVREGGTLEVHGEEKTSWTRLAQTLPVLSDLPCATVYDHSDQETNPFAKERRVGMHVMVWNEDGSVFDYNNFKPYAPLKAFVSLIPDGKLIGMFAYHTTSGLGSRSDSSLNFDALDDVIGNDLNGPVFVANGVSGSDSYSLLARKGSPSDTLEHYKSDGWNNKEPEGYLQLSDFTSKLVFQVATSAATRYHYFQILPMDVAYPILELADDVIGWNPGDKIVVASTDYDWDQAEVREIIDCQECSNSQIRVNESFRYRHYGNFTYNVDERAEVGLLSRNIVIEGVMEEECYATDSKTTKLCARFGQDTFGGHVKVFRGHELVRVQGAELYHMGQQKLLGAYPLHFHMCDAATGSWFKHNSIHHSFSRCVTIHGTDGVEASGNVCYDHLGHGFFLEDSVEEGNVINGNLGLGTRFGTLLMSDSTQEWCDEDFAPLSYPKTCNQLSTFWLTHPNNSLSGNAAAGGDGHGFMYTFAELPLALSFDHQQDIGKVKNFSVKYFPITKFYDNSAHSNRQTGIFMDKKISTGKLPHELEQGVPENGIVQLRNDYDPRNPAGDPNGERVWTTMERITTYKNKQENMWIKGGNIKIIYSSLADAPHGFTGGTTGFQTGTSVEYSIFIGQTDNLGKPKLYTQTTANNVILKHQFNRSLSGSPWKTVTAVNLYQGPMYIKHSYFDRYFTWHWNDSWTAPLGERPVRYGGAISFSKNSIYPIMTSQYTTNLTFGYCDGVGGGHWLFHGEHTFHDWKDTDGTRASHNRDADGSLTGTADTYIVRDHPFFTGDQCLPRPDWGGMSVCPYRYIEMEILGFDGNLAPARRTKFPLIVRRDDQPSYPFLIQGTSRREYLMRTHMSYLVDFNTTVAGASFPSVIKIYGYGVESQDVVRVGVCMPLDMTQFEIRSEYPDFIKKTNYTKVYTMADLDSDTTMTAFYHDTSNGIVFFKIGSRHDRTNDSQQCPAGKCFYIKIRLLDGTLGNIRSCSGAVYPPFVDTRTPPATPVQPACPGIASPEGLGAVRWNEVNKIIHEDFSVPCVTLIPPQAGRGVPVYQGCYVESTQQFELPQEFPKSMTRDWCTLRCYQRGYRYAGLSNAKWCSCGHTVNTSSAALKVKARTCTKPCSADSSQTCGHNNRLDVLTTGLP